MKFTLRSQRRRSSQTGPSVSLFPFLAVLICTMGALVPLLLAISRTARRQAEAAAAAKAAEHVARHAADLRIRREDVQWRIGQLKRSREQTAAELAEARLELGHVEDHSRRLRTQLAQYERTAAEYDQLEKADHREHTQAEAELEGVRRQIGATEQQVAEVRRAAAGRNRSYAIVPFEGPNQTHRRPIYIECRAKTVVLQPEGIVLAESDFEGPLGPGNPLAAALRAAREYLLAGRDFDPQAGEPYPMLLVRPDGIGAFYAARMAMKSWGSDFGYELIGDDWKLAYQPPDGQLANVYRQAVAAARVHQEQLIAAAPRQYGSRSKTAYRASNGGGFIRDGGGSDDDDDRGYAAASPSGPVGNNLGPGGGGRGPGGPGQGSGYGGQGTGGGGPGTGYGGQGTGGGGPGTGYGGQGTGGGGPRTGYGGQSAGGGTGSGDGAYNPYVTNSEGGVGAVPGAGGTGGYPGTSQGSGGGDGGYGGGGGNGGGGYGGQAAGGGNVAGGSQPGGAGSAGGGVSDASSAACPHPSPLPMGEGTSSSNPLPKGEGTGTERPDGYIVGQPPREQDALHGPPPPDAVYAPPLRPGEWQPRPDPPDRNRNDKDDDKLARHPKPKPVASKRGEDWALREAGRGAVGITRPMRVECYADRLVVPSDRGREADKVVPLGPRTASAIDPFISAVWEQMGTWGMAGRGMYWRPVLHVRVAPDAERRFAELSALLEGSGLTVERKQ